MLSGRIMFSRGRLAVLAAVATVACSEAPAGPGAPGEIRRPSMDVGALAAFTGNIRIGVVPAAASVEVGGSGDYEIRAKGTGATLFAGSGSSATVTLSSRSVVRNFTRLQIMCTSSVAQRDAKLAQATAAGHVTFTEFFAAGNCWRVYIGEFDSTVPFSVRNNYRLAAIASGLAPSDAFYRAFSEILGITEYKVAMGGAETISASPVVAVPGNGFVTINGAQFRGVAEVAQNSSGTLAGINELPMEEYLYGVVPRELPPVPYGEPEAQKAQAVAARTYAVQNLGKRGADGFDLLTTTADQVYGGHAAEHPISSAAVDATAGLVGMSNGALVSALYHSTSGGFTANSEDVFTTFFSYLRGVPDAERGQALAHVPSLDVFKRHANPTNLRALAEGDYESDWSRYHRWVVEWTREEMLAIVSASFNTTVTEVRSITAAERSDHGRVMRLVFDTDAGELVAVKDIIRSRLRYYEADGDVASLRSTLFWIEPVVDPKTKSVAGWKAYGGGWGHGVGMSQTGAVEMAERGDDFEQILKHYYQGIVLVRWY